MATDLAVKPQSGRRLDEVIGVSGISFGTSGARGLVVDMTDEVCTAYILAFLTVMRRQFSFDRVALGMDLRPSSPRITAACAAAIRGAGFEVRFFGALPTPALALHALADGIPAVMVSGSHIPHDRNGLKFYRPDGEISKGDELAILAADAPMESVAVAEGLPAPDRSALDAYARRYLDFFQPGLLTGLCVGLYEHSSVSRDVLASILRDLGAATVSLGRTDDFVPIDTEAVSAEDAIRGQVWATEHHLDAIISTDGDGDRPMLADERGTWLPGDLIGLICARELGISALAVPVSCNTSIETCGAFASVLRTRIGSPHVIAGMQTLSTRHARVAGFEANGGFLLGCSVSATTGNVLKPLPTRDAVLPAISVLAAARRAGIPVSSLLEGLPKRHTASDRLAAFPTERSSSLLAAATPDPLTLLARLGLGTEVPLAMDTTDGLRMTLGNGDIVHLRPSGNAPELRCYCEAGTPDRATDLMKSVLHHFESLREN